MSGCLPCFQPGLTDWLDSTLPGGMGKGLYVTDDGVHHYNHMRMPTGSRAAATASTGRAGTADRIRPALATFAFA